MPMFEAVTMPSLTMMTSTVPEESLVRDTHIHTHTCTHTHTDTDTDTDTDTYIHTHTHTCARTHVLIHMHAHKFTHTCDVCTHADRQTDMVLVLHMY